MQDVCGQIIDSIAHGLVAPVSMPRSEPVTMGRELDLVERIFILRKAPPFARCSINALAEVARAMVEVRYPPGVSLWHAGEPARNVVLVVSGSVRCTPVERPPFVTGPGWPLGALESLASLPRWYEPVTETPVIALSGDIESLYDVMEDNFDMAIAYLAAMGRWWLTAMERIADSHPELLKRFFGWE
jgi:CRP-like cAMP-binding protein